MTDMLPQLSHALATLLAAAFVSAAALFVSTRTRSSRHRYLTWTSSSNKPVEITTVQQLPRPRSTLPLLGNTLDMAVWQRERLYDWFLEQCELHKGPWRLQALGRPPVIVIASPELFEDVLKTQFDVFPRGENECEIFRDFFGDGIFSLNGDAWHRQRTAMGHLFAQPAMKAAMYNVVCTKVAALCHVIHAYASRNEAFSLKSVLTHFAADVFTTVALGVESNTLEHARMTGYNDDFVASSRTVSYALQLRFHQPMWLWKLKRRLNVGIEKQFKESVRHTDFLIYNIVNESIAKKHALTKAGDSKTTGRQASTTPPPRDLVSIFLEQNALTEAVDVDAQVIRDAVVNFISPGTDTTSHCMSFFLVMMNRYPRVLKRIRTELQTHVPKLFQASQSSLDAAQEALTLDELSRLVYLEAAIRESLRLNPQYPITAREASADTVLSDGTFVPKGTRVVMAFYAAMRQRSVWGHDALRFKPERWIDAATGDLIAVSPFKFSAFVAGPRKCLGMQFALMEVKMTMAHLLATFSIQTTENPWELTYQVGLAASVKGPVTVTASPLALGAPSSRPPETATARADSRLGRM